MRYAAATGSCGPGDLLLVSLPEADLQPEVPTPCLPLRAGSAKLYARMTPPNADELQHQAAIQGLGEWSPK